MKLDLNGEFKIGLTQKYTRSGAIHVALADRRVAPT